MNAFITNASTVSTILVAADAPAETSPTKIEVELATVTLVVFAILCIILYRVAWNPIMKGLSDREKSIADQIEDAKSSADKAHALLADYEARLAAATDEAKAVLAEAKAEGQRARDKIVAEAAEEAQRQKERAIAEIKTAKDQAIRELAQKSVDSAVALAGNLIKREVNAEAHSELIQQSLERFSENSGNN